MRIGLSDGDAGTATDRRPDRHQMSRHLLRSQQPPEEEPQQQRPDDARGRKSQSPPADIEQTGQVHPEAESDDTGLQEKLRPARTPLRKGSSDRNRSTCGDRLSICT